MPPATPVFSLHAAAPFGPQAAYAPVAPAGQTGSVLPQTTCPPGSTAAQCAEWTRNTQLMYLAGSLIGQTGSTIVGVVNSNNQLERDRLRNDTEQYIARLQAQMAATTNAQQQEQQRQQMEALQALVASLRQPPPAAPASNNTALYVGLGLAAVVAVGAVVYAASRGRKGGGARHNPGWGGHGSAGRGAYNNPGGGYNNPARRRGKRR